MKRLVNLIFILFLCSCFLKTHAQEKNAENKDVIVVIPLYDSTTKQQLAGVNAYLYNLADTSLIGLASYSRSYGDDFNFTIQGGKKYILQFIPQSRIVTDGGEVKYKENQLLEQKEIELDLRDYEGTRMELDPIYFGKRIRKDLNEVTVTPSRIMFYHKGDTLVYNANAFVLAEGSMLDALIQQLPGVSIDRNGVITCNGRKVENLLLNGKDFFNGKRELMLENISAYTVKNIAVYEKAGEISEMLNRKVQGDTQYVMDVRLKKEYMTGLMGNADVGYGTKERYLARLFGMWYSSSASVTVFGMANNLSSMANPGAQDGAWSASDISDGLKTNKSGGMTYTWSGPQDKLSLRGSADVKHVKTTVDQSRSTVNFLPEGDVYRLSKSRNISRNLSVATDHWLTYKLNRDVMLQAFPKFTYTDVRTAGDIIDVASSEEMESLKEGFGNFIYNIGGELPQNVISRYLSQSTSKGKTFDGNLLARTVLAVGPREGQRGALYVSANGSIKTHENYMLNNYSFTTRETELTPEEMRRYDALHPDRVWTSGGGLSYTCPAVFSSKVSGIDISIDYEHKEDRMTSNVYRLSEEVSTWNDADMLFNSIPELYEKWDAALSYSSFSRSDKVSINGKGSMEFHDEKYSHYFRMEIQQLGFSVTPRHYLYVGQEVNRRIDRTEKLFNISGNIKFFVPFMQDMVYEVKFSSTPFEAPLSQMVDIPSSDPTTLFLGNPDMKNAQRHAASLRITRGKLENIRRVYLFGARTTVNDFSKARIYDYSTGVTTYETRNVNGNWTGYGIFQGSMYLGKKRRMDLTFTTTGTFTSNVGLNGGTGEGLTPGIERSRVNTLWGEENVVFNYYTGRHRVSAHAEARVNRYYGATLGFTNKHSLVTKTGVSAVLNLPQDWGVSTDVNVYTRGGYTDSRLNTTDVVWNARITKSVMKGKMLFIVDAYDILRQLSNITYTVNAMSRVETVSNVIPAFVLFHVQYRFNRQPRGAAK